jgi:hypothetical protein
VQALCGCFVFFHLAAINTREKLADHVKRTTLLSSRLFPAGRRRLVTSFFFAVILRFPGFLRARQRRNGMPPARLLGISIFCLLLVRNSESFSDDVSALLAFKRAIYEDPLSKLSDWNSRDKDPCTWSGVGCSAFNSRVVTL